MSDKKGKTTLMILLTALGALAIIILFGWVAFFNPMDTNQNQEKPQLALSTIAEKNETAVLPVKSAEELLLDGLQKGEDTPLIIEDEPDKNIVILIDEPVKPVSETPASIVEEKVVEEVVIETPPVKRVEYKKVTEDIFWLQVGSFPNSVSADNLRRSLKERGIDSVMQTRDVSGTLYYRVRVGAFVSEAEAKSFKNKLLALSDIDEVTIYTDYVTKSVPVN